MILGVDGVSDFNALHSRKHDQEAQLYAFDMLAMSGDDLRDLPLHLRRTNLQRLLARRPDGITLRPSSAARSALIPGGVPHGSLKDWSPSTAIGLTAAAGRSTGSK